VERELRLLTVEEAASMLSLKPSTLYRWAEERKLPTVKLGRSVRVRFKDIEQLIAKNLRPALRDSEGKNGVAPHAYNA
jgi:excisionase family DNA binding protein